MARLDIRPTEPLQFRARRLGQAFKRDPASQARRNTLGRAETLDPAYEAAGYSAAFADTGIFDTGHSAHNSASELAR